jgi:hypothetical protein
MGGVGWRGEGGGTGTGSAFRADGDDRRGVPATIHLVSVRMSTTGAGSCG